MSESLFEEFEPVSAKQWKQKIQADLKGADYEQALIWHSPEGIDVRPFYNREDLDSEMGPIPGHPKSWAAVQRVFVHEEEVAHKLALEACERGAEAIWFSAEKEFDTGALLKGLSLEGIAYYFEIGTQSADWICGLVRELKKTGANFFLRYDPLGKLVSTGNWYHNNESDHNTLKQLIDLAPGNTLGVDLGHYQRGGANIVQQLAYSLCQAHTYLEFLKDKDHVGICFTVATGSNYFFEIAKIRALRWAYASLADAMGSSPECHVLAEPSIRNKSIYDYNTNMLRTTTECMSAVLGGADAMSNQPYDYLYHKSNEFGERISRNQLLILKAESYFDQVDNPSDGAYYIESLTRQLAERSLELFKELAANGNLFDHLRSGLIQRKIKEAAEKEQALFDSGDKVMIGSNVYQNPEDRMKDDLELYPFLKQRRTKTEVEPVVPKRLSEKIEKERLTDED